MKKFRIINRIGNARNVISHYDGASTHTRDGSPFWGITICGNKRKLAKVVGRLRREGYVEVT